LEKDGLAKLLSSDEKEKVPSYERFTIFNALMDAMKEKQQKKSRIKRFLHSLECFRDKTAIADTKPKIQDEQASSGETTESNPT
jgi:hypothetical protein